MEKSRFESGVPDPEISKLGYLCVFQILYDSDLEIPEDGLSIAVDENLNLNAHVTLVNEDDRTILAFSVFCGVEERTDTDVQTLQERTFIVFYDWLCKIGKPDTKLFKADYFEQIQGEPLSFDTCTAEASDFLELVRNIPSQEF